MKFTQLKIVIRTSLFELEFACSWHSKGLDGGIRLECASYLLEI